MKAIFLVTSLLISILGFSQTKNFIDQPYLETNAKVDTLIIPDRIYLNIVISEKDTKDKISVEELENKMASKLEALGINLEKQLTISDLSSNFKKYFLKQQDVLKSKAYSLIVYNGLMAGKVIQGLEQIGIANVEFEKTEYSKMKDLKLQLRSEAIVKAKNQGQAMLNPLGQNLGRAIHITDYNTNTYNGFKGRAGIQMAYSKMEDSTEPLDIDFEKIKVECEISVKFIIE